VGRGGAWGLAGAQQGKESVEHLAGGLGCFFVKRSGRIIV